MKHAVRAIVIKDGKLLVIKRNKFGLEYAMLPGGGIGPGESPEQALYREMAEETSVQIKNPRLVYVEPVDDMYGTQYVFLADFAGGEPALHPGSEEAKISALGRNIYAPAWLDLKDLEATEFRSEKLKQVILDGASEGFPDQTVKLY